jgi:hypothetical protein
MAFENVVRPAQLPDNQPPKTIRQRRTSRNWMPVVIKIESTGSPQIGSGSASQSVTYYQKRRPTERSKDSKTFLGFPADGSFLGITWP